MHRQKSAKKQVLGQMTKHGVEFVRLETLDLAGVVRCRVLRRNLLEKVFEDGLNMSTAIFSFTVLEHMVPDPRWGPEDADFYMYPDVESFTVVPYLSKTARMYSWLLDENGKIWEGDPRGHLDSLVAGLSREGHRAQLAFESEGYLMRKAGAGYEPADSSKCFTADGLDIQHGILHEIFDSLIKMGVKTEKATAEYGPGQYEINFSHKSPVRACDDFLTFRQAFRAIARGHGLVGTLMPKPFEALAGSGLHLHLNLVNSRTGKNVFFDKGDRRGIGLSKLGHHFLGGILEHAAALTAIGSPSVNSYRRMRPGTWAPAHVCYGVGNRAVMVRIPKRMAPSMRIEFRAADGTCNPYLLANALLAAGMHGVEEELDPGKSVTEDIGSWSDEKAVRRGYRRLPSDLKEAISALKSDKELMDRVSRPMLEGLVKIKEAEWDDYQCHVSEWERRTYLETF